MKCISLFKKCRGIYVVCVFFPWFLAGWFHTPRLFFCFMAFLLLFFPCFFLVSLLLCFSCFFCILRTFILIYILYIPNIPLFCPFQAIAILVSLACRACLASSRFASVACCSSCFSPCFGLGRRFVSSLLGFANPLPKAASTGTTTAAARTTATTLFFSHISHPSYWLHKLSAERSQAR